jgi:hypothetical protein
MRRELEPVAGEPDRVANAAMAARPAAHPAQLDEPNRCAGPTQVEFWFDDAS